MYAIYRIFFPKMLLGRSSEYRLFNICEAMKMLDLADFIFVESFAFFIVYEIFRVLYVCICVRTRAYVYVCICICDDCS